MKDKRILLRVDYNVPLKDQKITDDTRIKASIPTLKNILKSKPKQIIIISHLGKPGGKTVKELSLRPIAKRLQLLLRKKVAFVTNYKKIPNDKIVLLENLRFHKEEENNNIKFSKDLAKNIDLYVNDAFGTAHREHASVVGIPKYIKNKQAGLLMQNEIKALTKVRDHPKKPLILILGGAKVEDKLGVITKLSKKADKILIGGAMAFAFLKAQGYEVGKSLCKGEKIAKKLLKNKHIKNKIILPVDIVTANKDFKNITTNLISEIPKNKIGFDIGPQSIKLFQTHLKKANTIIWNGPLGLFEVKPFNKATEEIAKTLAKSKAYTVVGGGDSVKAVEKYKKKINHISTGGGASLQFLEGKKLPAITALEK